MVKFLLLVMSFSNGLMMGQALQFGAKGAVTLANTSLFNGDESRPYVVGPSVEFRLPKGFAIEGDALYQRVGRSSIFNVGGIIENGPAAGTVTGIYFDRMRGNSWQFPILAKRYFRVRSAPWQPFLSLGPSIRRVTYSFESNQFVTTPTGPLTFHTSTENSPNWSVGATAAAGVRLHKGRLAISPEFRYTRWGKNNGNLLKQNAVNAFLGFSF